MAAAITISGDALLGYWVSVSDADVADVVRVFRTDRSGHYEEVAVRGFDMTDITESTVDAFDYEAPLNTELRYTAELYVSSDLTTPIVELTTETVETTVPAGYAILQSVEDHFLKTTGGVLDLTSWNYTSRVLGSHTVLGRRMPVIITDVQGGRTGTIAMSNINMSELPFNREEDFTVIGPGNRYDVVRGSWDAIFRSGQTLLFRNTWAESGFDDCYFKVTGDVVATRLTTVVGTEPIPVIQYAIPFTEVEGLASASDHLVFGETWQDLLNHNTTWQDVLNKYSTWLDVLNDPTL